MYWVLFVIVLYTGTTVNIPVSGDVAARTDFYFNTQQACIDAGNAIVAASQSTTAGRQHVTVMPSCFLFP
jgi:hypothetical protein